MSRRPICPACPVCPACPGGTLGVPTGLNRRFLRPTGLFTGPRAAKALAKSWDEMIEIRGIWDARVQIPDTSGFPDAEATHDTSVTTAARGTPNPPDPLPANNFPTLLPKLRID